MTCKCCECKSYEGKEPIDVYEKLRSGEYELTPVPKKEKSAYVKWAKQAENGLVRDAHSGVVRLVEANRKEAWNAAIDAVLGLQDTYSYEGRDYLKCGRNFKYKTGKLKEPT